MKGSTMPSNSAITPIKPALRASTACTSNAVATMAKSRSMAPPTRPMPPNSDKSARPLWPPLCTPPQYARPRPITMAMAEPCTRPRVRYFDSATDTSMISPTTANAVTRPLWAAAFSKSSSMTVLLDQNRVGFGGSDGGRAFHPVNQRNHGAANDDGTDGGQHGHRPAAQRRHYILLRRHGHHHGNIHGAPVFDAPFRHLRQPCAALHVEPGADQ